jgi:hypothetical protein
MITMIKIKNTRLIRDALGGTIIKLMYAINRIYTLITREQIYSSIPPKNAIIIAENKEFIQIKYRTFKIQIKITT